MKIEAGKTYVTRSGVKVGPMKAEGTYFIEEVKNLMSITFRHARESWKSDGQVLHGMAADKPNEIVAEWFASLKIENGKQYMTRDGRTTGRMNVKGSIATCPDTDITVWTENGRVWKKGDKLTENDLVSECVAPLAVEAGKSYVTRSGKKATLEDRDYSSVAGYAFAGLVEGDHKPGNRIFQKDGKHGGTYTENVPDYDIVSEYVETEKLEIKIGKTYLTRDGRKVGPMIASPFGVSPDWPFSVADDFPSNFMNNWRIDGTFHPRRGFVDDCDLVSEVTEEPVSTPILVEIGKKYVTKSGVVVGPMVEERYKDWLTCSQNSVVQVICSRKAQVWRPDGSVPYMDKGEEDHVIVSEYVAPILTIKEGGYYETAEGVVEGPMTPGIGEDCWKSENPVTMQSLDRTEPQIWNDDGTVSVPCDGEELHHFVAEVEVRVATEIELANAEIERLKAVISGMKGKLDRVQNIHAHTIKSVRKARAEVKKANKALSEEQRIRSSLDSRLSEVVNAITEVKDYVGGIHRTAPKEKRRIAKVNVGGTNVCNVYFLKSLIPDDRAVGKLYSAFVWDTTPQGWTYWSEKADGKKQITAHDILFFKALLDKIDNTK